LLKSTVGGLGGLPPGGQCFACSAGDYEALIRFMADHAS
jgi:cytochrome c5